MTASLVTLSPEDTVEQAARFMANDRIGCVPVVEANLWSLFSPSMMFSKRFSRFPAISNSPALSELAEGPKGALVESPNCRGTRADKVPQVSREEWDSDTSLFAI